MRVGGDYGELLRRSFVLRGNFLKENGGNSENGRNRATKKNYGETRATTVEWNVIQEGTRPDGKWFLQ